MMNSANLSGLIGSRYLTVFVDFGPQDEYESTVFGVRGYSFNIGTATAAGAATHVLQENTKAGYPAFMIVTDKFFYGAIDTDYFED